MKNEKHGNERDGFLYHFSLFDLWPADTVEFVDLFYWINLH